MSYINPVPTINDISDSIPTIYEGNEGSDYHPLSTIFFAFIDVLGFKKDYDDLKISHKEEETNNKYKNVFNYYFGLMNSAKFVTQTDEDMCYVGQTSDTLYFYTSRPDFLLMFIKLYSYFSVFAMSKNVFFRGGIAKGSLYAKEKYQFYGDSVIGAYLLESNISNVPIITIDHKTADELKKLVDDDNYKKLIHKENNRNYLDPFYALKNDVSFDEILEEDGLRAIKSFEKEKIKETIEKNIEENMQLYEYDDKTYKKYLFLKNKINEKE